MPTLNGAKIRELRVRSGVKIGAFATSVQASQRHLGNIERSAVPASIELAHRIAMALKVDVEEFLLDDNESTSGAPTPASAGAEAACDSPVPASGETAGEEVAHSGAA